MLSKPTIDTTTFVFFVCFGCLALGCGGPATIEDGENTVADPTTDQTAPEQPDELAADPPATLGTPEELAAADLTPEELAAADLATSEVLAAADLTPEELAGADLPTELTRSAVAKPPSSVGGRISRGEILSRAMLWRCTCSGPRCTCPGPRCTYPAPLCTSPDPQGTRYRADCAGFVSMALHLPVSATTVTLPLYVRAIRWSDLKPGDIVGTLGSGTGGANGHVVIFHSWANSAHTMFNTLEMKGGSGTIKYKRPVGFRVGSKYAKPYIYKKVIQ